MKITNYIPVILCSIALCGCSDAAKTVGFGTDSDAIEAPATGGTHGALAGTERRPGGGVSPAIIPSGSLISRYGLSSMFWAPFRILTAPAAATIVSRPSTSITRTNLSLKSWFTLSFTFYHLGTILTKVTRLIQIPSFKISTFWK